MNFRWEQLADGVSRTRLPFLDVTVGLTVGDTAIALVDTGSTLTEAEAIRGDVLDLTGREVTHIVLTHKHFDHVLGFPAFDGAMVYCAPAVAEAVTRGAGELRSDAVRHGADPARSTAQSTRCAGLTTKSGRPSSTWAVGRCGSAIPGAVTPTTI